MFNPFQMSHRLYGCQSLLYCLCVKYSNFSEWFLTVSSGIKMVYKWYCILLCRRETDLGVGETMYQLKIVKCHVSVYGTIRYILSIYLVFNPSMVQCVFMYQGWTVKPTTKIVNIGIQFWDNLKFHAKKSLALLMAFNDWHFRLYQYCFDLSVTGLCHCLTLCIHDCLFNQISYLSMYIFMVFSTFFFLSCFTIPNRDVQISRCGPIPMPMPVRNSQPSPNTPFLTIAWYFSDTDA